MDVRLVLDMHLSHLWASQVQSAPGELQVWYWSGAQNVTIVLALSIKPFHHEGLGGV